MLPCAAERPSVAYPRLGEYGRDCDAKARRARPQRTVALAVAAVVLGLVLFVKRHEVVAWLKGELPTLGPDPSKTHKDAPPTALARQLRKETQTACNLGQWGTCEDTLDEAEQLDPAGEAEGDVQALRADIDEWTHLPDGGHSSKHFK